jgi:pimeloyl-ACP methyl ester carboxylesterase
LEARTGESLEVWSAVQTEVEQFTNICSYDRLGLGRSDKLAVAHTADEIVADLHGLLYAASIREPYILFAHSIGGIYARKYADLYPVAGASVGRLAHEEQFTRMAQISPETPPVPRESHTTTPKRRLYQRVLDRPIELARRLAPEASACPPARGCHCIFSHGEIKRWNITLLTSDFDGSESAISS